MNVWDWNDKSDIDLDWLKANHVRLYYFGLGFIQLKIDETHRIHFYSRELPVINEDVHNHRYNFESKVLHGCFTNNKYDVVDGNSHLMVNESCSPIKEAPLLNQPCSIKWREIMILIEGMRYKMTSEEFHTVHATSCITLLKREPVTKEFAQIIVPTGSTPTCPFSLKYPKEQLWRMIERML